ncbi:MAG TPA: hypothetical protein VFA12_14050 [Stellaceae bacterium]|nr:hypothetical protein [Stellaceae bacterium]
MSQHRAAPLRSDLHEHLLPSTFAERGAIVPFTTPLMSNARVRKDWRDRLELVISGFADGAGEYVLPWDAAADVVSMTAHDTMLHEEVMNRQALDPYGIRQAALDVAKTGLAGPEVADAAARSAADDEAIKELNEAMLTLRLIAEIDRGRADALRREVGTSEGRARVREALTEMSSQLKLDGAAFSSLAQLGGLTCAVCVPDSPTPGRLRRLVRQLGDFRVSVSNWGAERLGVVAEQAGFCAAVAANTLRTAEACLAEFDAAIARPGRLIANGKGRSDQVQHLVGRLAWMLDGWDRVVEAWAEAADDNAKINILGSLVQVLPLLPRKEAEADSHRNEAQPPGTQGRRWVHTNEDWRTGEPDPEMVQRLEALKAKTL